MSDVTETEPRAALRAVAELMGRLLLRELTADDLTALRDPGLAPALAELGLELPAPADQAAWLEQRAADYHDRFLRPQTGPLVQSLWSQGRYEGDATVRVRQLAEAAGVEFQREAARGAAVDHLGSLLLLWAATAGPAPAVASEIVKEHLAWALTPLGQIEAGEGFYGAEASGTADLIQVLTDPAHA